VDVRDARGFFPGLDDKVFLDAATVSLAPVQAREAIERFLERAVLCPERDASTHHIAMDELRGAAVHEAAILLGLRGLRMIFEPPTLRHFTARFEPVD
jgi:cysteine desulfurase/selenocysteine lyase